MVNRAVGYGKQPDKGRAKVYAKVLRHAINPSTSLPRLAPEPAS